MRTLIIFLGWDLFNSPNHQVSFGHRYRFSDKFSISHNVYYNPAKNDAGYYDSYYNGSNVLTNILFSRRDRETVENIMSFKYNFNNKSGVTIRVRHYWSKVKVKELYDLQDDGTLKQTTLVNPVIEHKNYNILNVDAVYTWQFAPGSFINIVWKDQSDTFNDNVRNRYFKNFGQTVDAPQNNNLSFKIIYYLDYLDFKKWRKGKA